MNARTLLPAVLTAIVATATGPHAPARVAAPAWFEGTFPEALAAARERRTLVFVDFSPDW